MRYTLTFLFLISLSDLSAQQDTVSVYFSFGSYQLDDLEVSKLNGLEGDIVKLIAYTDTIGSSEVNFELATRRAQNVMDIFKDSLKSNVAQQIIGENYPIKKPYEAKSWRRVDVIMRVAEPVAQKVDPLLQMIEEENQTVIEQLVDFLQDSTVSEQKIDLTIQFYPGLPVILKEYEGQLWVLFDFLRLNTNVSAEINGHVCCADDYPLSYDRAHMVYDFLVTRSISPKRLKYQGFSNKRPKVSPELNDLDRQQNRRVEVILRKN